MNIGLFTDMYFPRISGVVTSAQILEKQLTKLGHKVYIFTTADPAAPRFESRVYRLPSVPLFFLKDTHRMAFFYPPRLIYKVKKLKLDVVHTYTEFTLGFFGKLMSSMFSVPMVHTYHTMYEDYTHYVANGKLLTKDFAKKFSRVFCNRANVVIAPSEHTADYLNKIGVKRPIYTIPTGLEFSTFNPTGYSAAELRRARVELGIDPQDKVVAVIGRVAKEKSIDVLINAMQEVVKSVPNCKLLIVGDGPAKEDLVRMASELGILRSVVFAGIKPWSEIGKYYCLSDCFATASTTETQGLTYIEAMAARLPVVVKKDRPFEKLVRDGETGYIFEHDTEAGGKIIKALTMPKQSSRIALNAYTAVQPLSAEVFGLELERVYMGIQRNASANAFSTRLKTHLRL